MIEEDAMLDVSTNGTSLESPTPRVALAFLLLPFFALFLLAAGCEAPEADLEPPAEVMEEPVEAEAPPEVTHATIPLSEVNGSGVTGEAMAMHDADQVTVVIELEGLPSEGEYAAHVHVGTCEEGGPVGAPLNPVMGLADGTGSSTTILDAEELAADESHFIQVHGEGGAPIACGDIEGHGNGDGT
jgi:hypothetical protein